MMENGINAVNCDKLRNIAEDCDKLRNIAVKLQKIAEYYGEMNQVIKTSEELAELNQVLMKYLTAGNGLPNVRHSIVSEIADVTIMIGQLCYLWKIDEKELLEAIRIKINRQMERIRNGK